MATKKSLGQGPTQELEVGPRSWPYSLVLIKRNKHGNDDDSSHFRMISLTSNIGKGAAETVSNSTGRGWI